MIKTFSKDRLYKVGDRFNTLVTNERKTNNCTKVRIFHNVIITEIGNNVIWCKIDAFTRYIKYHDNISYRNSYWYENTNASHIIECDDNNNTIKVTDVTTYDYDIQIPFDEIDYTT